VGRSPATTGARNKEQVLANFAKQAELTGGTFRLEVHDVVANDDHGIVLVAARADRGDRSWEDHAVLVFHIRDGKISEAWLHPGDQYAGDDFFS